MNTIKLIFCTTHDPVSWAIRLDTNSQWSHVGFVEGGAYDDKGNFCGGNVIEAISKKGVHVELLSTRIAESSSYELVDIECENPEAILNAARSQIGKPYDYGAIIDLAIRDRDSLNDERSWFCSELVAWAFDKGGSPKFRKNCVSRITPDDVYLLYPAN